MTASPVLERSGEPAPRRFPWGAAAWIGILAAIGVVQIVREQWFDAIVLLSAAALLVFEAAAAPRGGTRRPSLRTVVLALFALGMFAAVLTRHSEPMQIAVCATGLVAIVLTWPQREGRGVPWTPGQRRLAISWACVLVAGCLWELAEFIVGRVHPSNPSWALSDLLDPLVATRPGQIAFAAAWVALGGFLVTRGRR